MKTAIDKPCPAQKRARITIPSSQAGISFCTEKCPYPDEGIMFKEKSSLRTRRKIADQRRARRLRELGYSPKSIAATMGKSLTTIQRWLRE